LNRQAVAGTTSSGLIPSQRTSSMAEPVKKNGFKYWIGRLHLWLGLSTGAIVCFLGITGALYVFENDITRIMRRDAIYPWRAEHCRQRSIAADGAGA
jgi:hypothetical protein